MAKKNKRYQPSRKKLDEAIGNILDKAINADSSNAAKQLHLILTTEHPLWKLPERRVAKYLKRQLKQRNNDMYKEIDADLDEVSLYSHTTDSTWRQSVAANQPVEVPAGAEPAPAAAVEVPSAPKAVAVEEKKEKNGEDSPLFCAGCVIS